MLTGQARVLLQDIRHHDDNPVDDPFAEHACMHAARCSLGGARDAEARARHAQQRDGVLYRGIHLQAQLDHRLARGQEGG